ncbi:hypothetical protein [Beihai picobirna-like virus 8]|uniref:hypothetical protein n=1 Tax=Beihai picobirna-like virus 8 TaxID=1922525 RepID=UPI00090C15A7|nr:hypothetical protein [Beihai picobirna-like virus 8]APG78175.1 hypothetical protein [Beihai picobirna-like virus 8]
MYTSNFIYLKHMNNEYKKPFFRKNKTDKNIDSDSSVSTDSTQRNEDSTSSLQASGNPAFVPGGARPWGVTGSQSIPPMGVSRNVYRQINGGVARALGSDIGKAVIGEVASYGLTKLNSKLNDFESEFENRKPPRNKGKGTRKRGRGNRDSGSGNGGGGSDNNYSGNSSGERGVPYGGSPMPYRNRYILDTGMSASTIIDDDQNTTDHWSPLLTTNGSLLDILWVPQTRTYDVIRTYVFDKYLDKLQQDLNPEYTIDTDVFGSYLSDVSEALQAYYTLGHIRAFAFGPYRQQNIALYKIGRRYGSDVIDAHRYLKSKLENLPIPPRLVHFMYYFTQNFTMHPTPASPCIRINYRGMFLPGKNRKWKDYGVNCSISADLFKGLIDNLDKHRLTYNKINRICPELKVGQLMDPSCEVIYDEQFNTWWHNHCTSYWEGGKLTYTRNVADLRLTAYYGQYTNRLDTAIYASSDLAVRNAEGDYYMYPGVWCPFNGWKNTDAVKDEGPLTSINYWREDKIYNMNYTSSKENVKWGPFSNVYKVPLIDDHEKKIKIFTGSDCGVQIAQEHNAALMGDQAKKLISWIFET